MLIDSLDVLQNQIILRFLYLIILTYIFNK